MKINKRKLVYLTSMSEAWAEPYGNETVYIELLSRFNDKQIEGLLSVNNFPKSLLEYQLKTMAKKIYVPFSKQCIIGRWGYKRALNNL